MKGANDRRASQVLIDASEKKYIVDFLIRFECLNFELHTRAYFTQMERCEMSKEEQQLRAQRFQKHMHGEFFLTERIECGSPVFSKCRNQDQRNINHFFTILHRFNINTPHYIKRSVIISV